MLHSAVFSHVKKIAFLKSVFACLTRPDEDEGGVEGDVGEHGDVVERVLLRPRPHADRQDAQSDKLESDIDLASGKKKSFHGGKVNHCLSKSLK